MSTPLRKAPTFRIDGDKVRTLRIAAGLTTTDIGYACGVNAATISRIELEHRDARAATIAGIAWALGVKIDDLITVSEG